MQSTCNYVAVHVGGIPQAAKPLVISLELFAIMTALSIAGVIFAVVCIVFNLVFRKKRWEELVIIIQLLAITML